MAKSKVLLIVLFIILAQARKADAKTTVELLKDLRKGQINAMIKEEEKKISMNTPDQIATATYHETRKRVLKADSDIFEINATPYSPFKAEKSPKNLGYLGRGYDALFGNPLDEAGRVDPGFRLQAVELSYLQNRFSNDGEYRIPDNADVIMQPSALFSSTFNDVRTENDYKQQLNEDVKTTTGFGFGVGFLSVSGEFSQSKSYQSTKESIKKGGKVNIDIVGRAIAYKAYLHTLGNMNVTETLQNAIQALPEQCSNSEGLSPYYRIIQKFGTHFTTVVTMGAKAVQRLTMTTEESMNLKQEGITTSQVVSATVGFSVKGVSANANFGHEKGSSSDTKITESLKKMNIQRREFYIGGEPPSLPYSQRYYYSVELEGEEQNDDPGIGSTDSLREWGRSAFEKPVPIQYQLLPITDLFQKPHLPNVDETEEVIGNKKNCMKKALTGYCAKVAADAGDCVSYDDDGNEPNAIRYGDLIAIQKGLISNPSNYLEVPESNPQFAVGNKPDYMKVMPVDSHAYWKYGNALHYGEPFNLLSEYGGQQKIVGCGYGDNKHYAIFNYGKNEIKITCEYQGFPVDQWPGKEEKWCKKEGDDIISDKKRTVRECEVNCVNELGDECVGIQYIETKFWCSYCKKEDQSVAYNNDLWTSPVFFYGRLDKEGVLPQPQLTATLYFASPSGKKQGDIVMENDKAYIGVTSYESRDSLFDVRRPAFLKAVKETIQVHQDDGKLNTKLNELKTCTDQPKDTHLECSYWWKILATQKTLHTYPNVHFDKESQSPGASSR